MGNKILSGLKKVLSTIPERIRRITNEPEASIPVVQNQSAQPPAAKPELGGSGVVDTHHVQTSTSDRAEKQTVHSTLAASIDIDQYDIPEGRADRFKQWFIETVAFLGPVFIGFVLAVGNGYLFSGFKDFALDDPMTAFTWIGGFILEAVALGALFHASLMRKRGKTREFWQSMSVALFMALISFSAQVIFLQSEIVNNLALIDSTVEHTPILNLLIGVNNMQGHDVLLVVRAAGFHCGEIACSFLINKQGKDLKTDLARRTEIAQARQALTSYNMAEQMQNMVMDNMKAMMDDQRRKMEAQFNRVRVEEENPQDKLLAGLKAALLEQAKAIEVSQQATSQKLDILANRQMRLEAAQQDFLKALPEIPAANEQSEETTTGELPEIEL